MSILNHVLKILLRIAITWLNARPDPLAISSMLPTWSMDAWLLQVVRNKKGHVLRVTEGMFLACVFVLCNIYYSHFSGMKRSKYVLVMTRGVDRLKITHILYYRLMKRL
jgi:hypothetical protein